MAQTITEYLEEHLDRVWTKGKNVHVKRGAVAVRCPFCDDSSNHLQIYPNGEIQCWKCRIHGGIARLIREIEGCGWRRADEIAVSLVMKDERIDDIRRPDDLEMPDGFIRDLPGIHRKYLEGRNFDPDRISRDYGVGAVHNVGIYSFRLIIPMILDGRTVHFTGRDVTDKSKLRYKNCPDDRAVVPSSELLYNIDSVTGSTVLIVEGPTDVWRMGIGTVAMMTTHLAMGRVDLLRRKGVKRVFVMYDTGAEEFLPDLVSMIYWTDEVFGIRVPDGFNDPAELPEDVAKALRREIF